MLLYDSSGENANGFWIVDQFGGARLLTSRLAKTLAPPKLQTHPLPVFGNRTNRAAEFTQTPRLQSVQKKKARPDWPG
jgi:hypothetical protein